MFAFVIKGIVICARSDEEWRVAIADKILKARGGQVQVKDDVHRWNGRRELVPECGEVGEGNREDRILVLPSQGGLIFLRCQEPEGLCGVLQQGEVDDRDGLRLHEEDEVTAEQVRARSQR